MQPAKPQPDRLRSLEQVVARTHERFHRLFVLWAVSAIVLLVLLVLSVLLTRGAIASGQDRARRDIRALRDQLGDALLTQEVLQARVAELERALENQFEQTTGDAASTNAQPTGDAHSLRTPPTDRAADPTALSALLQTALSRDDAGNLAAADDAFARALLAHAKRFAGESNWSGAQLERLAVLALASNDAATAEALATQARGRGRATVIFDTQIARAALARGDVNRALDATQRLLEQDADEGVARLLFARAMELANRPSVAVAAVEPLGAGETLNIGDRIALAELLVRVEQWRQLRDVLASLPDVAPLLRPRVAFLQAVDATIHDDSAGALDALAELRSRNPQNNTYALWMAIAQTNAGQHEDALATLEPLIDQEPSAPVRYWLGVIQGRLGSTDAARAALEEAIAISPQHAPTFEALASLHLASTDADEAAIRDAIALLDNAIDVAPQRARSYALRAVAFAKLSERGPTMTSARTALELDPNLLPTLAAADVITRLIDPADLASLAERGDAEKHDAPRENVADPNGPASVSETEPAGPAPEAP